MYAIIVILICFCSYAKASDDLSERSASVCTVKDESRCILQPILSPVRLLKESSALLHKKKGATTLREVLQYPTLIVDLWSNNNADGYVSDSEVDVNDLMDQYTVKYEHCSVWKVLGNSDVLYLAKLPDDQYAACVYHDSLKKWIVISGKAEWCSEKELPQFYKTDNVNSVDGCNVFVLAGDGEQFKTLMDENAPPQAEKTKPSLIKPMCAGAAFALGGALLVGAIGFAVKHRQEQQKFKRMITHTAPSYRRHILLLTVLGLSGVISGGLLLRSLHA